MFRKLFARKPKVNYSTLPKARVIAELSPVALADFNWKGVV